MQQQMNRWFVIRLVVTGLSCLSGLQGDAFALSPSAPSGMAWRVFGIVFAVVLIGGSYSFGGAYRTKGVTTDWIKPSWYQNPFQSRSQPLQFFHLVTVCAIAEGVGALLRALTKAHFERFPAPGIPLGFGLGGWIALRLCVKIFHRKHGASDTGSEHRG